MHERSPIVAEKAVHRPPLLLWVAVIVLLFALASVTVTAGFAQSGAQLASQPSQLRGSATEAIDRQTPRALPHRATEVGLRDTRRAGSDIPPEGKHALLPGTPTSLITYVPGAAVAPIPAAFAPNHPRHFYNSQAPPSLIA